MSTNEKLLTVSANDIDWTTVSQRLDGYDNAKCLNAGFPTHIYGYINNVAEVKWQINPDGRYYMDEDGYGMSNDREESLFGFIDRNGKVVEPFRYLGYDIAELKVIRIRAEQKVNAIK